MRKLISGDASNMEVSGQAFQLLHAVAARRLAEGRTVVIDSTALEYEARRELVALAEHAHAPVQLLLLEGSRALCLEGQRYRDRKVPEEAVDRHLGFQADLINRIESKQMHTEGFSSVLRLSRRQVAELEHIDLV
jgi:protein phosphatase